MTSSAVAFVASLTDPATIRDELARTLALQADITARIPSIIAETSVQSQSAVGGAAWAAGRGSRASDAGDASHHELGSGASDASDDDSGGGEAGGASLAPLVNEVDTLARTTKQLTADLSVTSQQAEQAISRIRELDITMSRAQLALERVEDILDLQQCLGGVQRCLDRGDLLGAASTIKRFKAVQKLIPVADRDRQLMQRAEASLLQTVASKFDAAVSVGDSSEVTRCCQLMSVLGNSRQGLQRYGKYVNQLLDQFVTEQRRRFAAEDGRGEAVNLLSALFSKGAALLKQAEALADKFMMDDAQAQVLLAVHGSVDSIAAGMVSDLLTHPRVVKALKDRDTVLRACEEFTRGAPHGGPSSERGGVNHDELPPELRNEEAPLELDALLTELAIVCQRCVSFGRLMRGKAAHIDAVAAAAAQAEQMRQERRRRGQSASGAGVLAGGDADGGGGGAVEKASDRLREANQLAMSLGELAGVYSMLEEAFMTVTITKATHEDEVNEDLSGTLIVEDAFYILQKCGRRAINTGSSDCACSVVNHICGALIGVVMAEMKARATRVGTRSDDPVPSGAQLSRFDRLKQSLAAAVAELEAEAAEAATVLDPFAADTAGAGAGAPAAATAQAPPQKIKALAPDAAFGALALNNLLACMVNTQRIRRVLEEEMDGVFVDELSQAKLNSCLSELDAVAVDFRKTMQTSLGRLCASLTPRIRGIMTPMEGSTPIIKYQLTDDEFAENETYDVFEQELLAGLGGIIKPFKLVLRPELYSRMVTKVAAYLGKQIENVLRRRKFNQLGGLQLDKDVRSLSALFMREAGGDPGVRQRLRRLVEISRVVSVTDADEVRHYWDNQGASLTLSTEDVIRFLESRVDMNPSSVKALKSLA